jgi:hypothetical protein
VHTCSPTTTSTTSCGSRAAASTARTSAARARRRPGELRDVCEACRDEAAKTWDGIVGEPEIAVEASTIAATHTPIDFAWSELVDLQPVRGADRNVWLGVDAAGTLFAIDLDNRRARSRGPGRNAMPRASSCFACHPTDLSQRSWSARATTA